MIESRTTNSIKNTVFAISEQTVCNIFQFITRTVFIYSLGKIYLGFSGLFSDVLTLISLAELGVGTAITHSMYKPASENNEREVAALLHLYKNIYTGIGIIMTIVGLCLIPFLDSLISGIPDIPELSYIYILYLLNTSCSYFLIYKKSILITYQKSYISSIIFIGSSFVKNIFQIIILLVTHNFILYLWIQLLFTIIYNIGISLYVDRKYIFLQKYKNEHINQETKKKILSNIGAMFISKISSAVVTSTDNILISKFVSTIILGLYSNYTLFTTMFRTIITKVFEGITGSVGNLIVTSEKEKVYDTFKNIWFVNFWLAGFSCAGLYVLVNPFIELWIGSDYLLSKTTVCIVCINLYMRLIRNTFIVLTDTCGLFKEFRIKSIVEAIVNLCVSLILLLVFDMGINGVLLGTLTSNLVTNFWFEPYIIYKKVFSKQLVKYFGLYFKYIIFTIISAVIADIFSGYILLIGGWIGFAFDFISTVILINGIFLLIFCNTKELRYFSSIIKDKL